MNNSLIDNSEGLELLGFIKKILELDVEHISIATGFWDVGGISLLADKLDAFLQKPNTSLRILIGCDPYLRIKYNANPKYKSARFPEDFIKTEINEIEVKAEYQNAVEFLLKYLDESDKIKIRLYKKDKNAETEFLHSKCYIFVGKNKSYGIIGSSNFTQKGLQGNAELNYLETDGKIVTAEPKYGSNGKGHLFWFNEKWKNSTDWTKDFLEEVLKPSPIGQEVVKKRLKDYQQLSPYQTYIKFLIEHFGEVIDMEGKISPDEYSPKAPDFKKLLYQSEAVNYGFMIMKQHGGFILADVVGLGKTYTALMVVKRYLLETGFKNKVLVIAPPAIKQTWIEGIEYFDENEEPEKLLKPKVYITTIGLLSDSEELDNDFDDSDNSFEQKDYGIIVVDESHRFRNSDTKMYDKLDSLIGDISPQPYVILLSATPQNNRPNDLKNQILLFQREPNSSTLQNLGSHGNNLISYFAEKEKNYEAYIKKNKMSDGKKISKTAKEIEEDKKNLIKDSEDIRKKIVEPLVIRRTRTDIEKYYREDMQMQNLTFPKIQAPISIPYEMKGDLAKLFTDTINIIAPQINHINEEDDGQTLLNFSPVSGEDALGYYRYRTIEFLKLEENKKRYKGRSSTVSAIAKQLASLMEIFLVKRLESSQAAFKESLHNLKRYTENMIRMWEADRIFICPDIDVNAELNDEKLKKYKTFSICLDVLSKKAKQKNKKVSGDERIGANQEYKKSDFDQKYIKLLKNDLRLIEDLCKKWDVQTNDPKIETFLRKIDSEFFNEKRNTFKKLIVFTECIATQKALVQKINNCASEYNVLSITSNNRVEKEKVIKENFDANIPESQQKDDYQILITTDVLAEGVNLHRANSILNYDSPWNATRLMQRLGRINRIGTKADKIWNYNFYPSTLGDQQINLKKRTYMKLQAFHELFGEDSQIYSLQEEVKHFDKVDREYLFEEAETPIMPFIAELRNFKKENPEDYAKLSEIQKPVACFAKNKFHFAFANLREIKDDKTFISKLYVSKNNKTKQFSQLEFFELLKDVVNNKTQSENINSQELKSYEEKILERNEIDTQNEKIKYNARKTKKDKSKNTAIRKIQNLYNKIYAKSMREKLDDIANYVRAGNASLIQKINSFDFDKKDLKSIENKIDDLYKGLNKRAKNKDTKVNIILVSQS